MNNWKNNSGNSFDSAFIEKCLLVPNMSTCCNKKLQPTGTAGPSGGCCSGSEKKKGVDCCSSKSEVSEKHHACRNDKPHSHDESHKHGCHGRKPHSHDESHKLGSGEEPHSHCGSHEHGFCSSDNTVSHSTRFEWTSEGCEARDDGAPDDEGALCLAVVGANGTDISLIDASGNVRGFSYKGDIRKLCFSSHGQDADDLLTPCFDEDGVSKSSASCPCDEEQSLRMSPL